MPIVHSSFQYITNATNYQNTFRCRLFTMNNYKFYFEGCTPKSFYDFPL